MGSTHSFLKQIPVTNRYCWPHKEMEGTAIVQKQGCTYPKPPKVFKKKPKSTYTHSLLGGLDQGFKKYFKATIFLT